MSFFLLRCWWPALLITFLLSTSLFAQQPTVDPYSVRITTKEGYHLRGILTDVDSSYAYVGYGSPVALSTIRKITLRRKNKTPALITGAIVGGLLTGYLAQQSLQTNQVRSPVSYIFTIAFATTGGAAAGLLVGSGVHSFSRKVIRPIGVADPNLYLLRQLTPFSTSYQRGILNRLPNSFP